MNELEFTAQVKNEELRYSCLQLAKEILLYRNPTGQIDQDQVIELANKYYNWIKQN
jgi:hypothetical protein